MIHPAHSGNRVSDTGRNAGAEDGVDDHRRSADEELSRKNRGDLVGKPLVAHTSDVGERLIVLREA